jgi:Regulator of chromosome condensation (RCC1) repeat
MNTSSRVLRLLNAGGLLAIMPACAQTITAVDGDAAVDAGHDLGSPGLVDVASQDTTTDGVVATEASVSADVFVPCETPACRQRAIELHATSESVMVRLADGRTLGWGLHVGRAMGPEDFRLGPRAVAVPAGGRLYVGQTIHCRIDPEYSLWCWGADGYELLGTNPRFSRRGPETARWVMAEVRDVALSDTGLCALRLSGNVDCLGSQAGWASEVAQQQGHSSVPVRAFGVSGVRRMSEGIGVSTTFCALTGSATYCWGPASENLYWRSDSSGSTPQLLLAWQGATRLAAGTCSLDQRGALGCAGGHFDAATGELQPFGRPAARTRVEMQGVPLMTDLTIGGPLCTVDVDGRVWCGGENQSGQVGVGSTSPWVPFQPLSLPEAAEQVRCGQLFCCARTRSGQVWCWGDNREGQLGRPSTTLERSLVPVRVTWD